MPNNWQPHGGIILTFEVFGVKPGSRFKSVAQQSILALASVAGLPTNPGRGSAGGFVFLI